MKYLKSPIFLSIFPYFLIFCIGFLALSPLLHEGLPLTHDGKDHVARIANFYSSLQDGVIVPRWAANLNWGYGHPVLMFLYPLPSYVSSFFHFFGFSLIESIKIIFGLSFLLSGMTMYLWMAKILNRYAGFFAAMLYMYAPYRFVDLYVRGALGEHVAFIFPPLVLYFMERLSKERTMALVSFCALSFAGLLLSHNAISLMFLPIFGLYGLYLLLHAYKKKVFLLYLFASLLLGFSLAAFFWIPALLEGKYTLRNIVTDADYAKRFVQVNDFFFSSWSFGGTALLSKQVGIVQWILFFAICFSTVKWYKSKKIQWQLALGSIVIFLGTLLIMTEYTKIIWDQIILLQNFQFPWRFLAVVVFITAFFGGMVVTVVSKKYTVSFVIIFSVFLIVSTFSYWRVNGYLILPDSFFKQVYKGTTDTGESAPIWSVRFMEKIPFAPMEIIEGKGKITILSRNSTIHTYRIHVDEKMRVRENTLYFPGWKVFVDSVVVEPEFQDPKHRGLMTFYVEKGTRIVTLVFEDTKIRTIANGISLFALVIMGFFCIMSNTRIWKRFR